MTISYTTANGASGTVVPDTISWTPTSHGASSYLYTMTFAYGTNVLPPAGYLAGTPVENSNLLGSITVDESGAQVKEYVLTYQQSGTTSRDLLEKIQECAASTSDCLAPTTTVNYQAGSVGVSSSATVTVSNMIPEDAIGPLEVFEFSAHHDFNGDGYQDIVYVPNPATDWHVEFGSSSGYGSPVDTGISGALGQKVVFGDLLGNGDNGILADNDGTWWYYTWNGSSFVGQSTGIPYDASAEEYALADVNGDGLPDLVKLSVSSAGLTVYTQLNTSSGSSASFSASVITAYSEAALGLDFEAALATSDVNHAAAKHLDFNGDGLEDLWLITEFCDPIPAPYGGYVCEDFAPTYYLLANPSGTFTATGADGLSSVYSSYYFANTNDDACTDTIQRVTIDSSFVYAAACNGSADLPFTSQYKVVGVLDWDGDGHADLLETDGTSLYVQLSTESGFSAAQGISIPYVPGCNYIPVDPNGDGLDGLACLDGFNNGATGMAYYPHNGTGQKPDLLSNITDGYGNSASPSYVSLPRATNAYYFLWNDAQYPYENVSTPVTTCFSD